MWLRRTASALKRVIATLAVGAVSGCAAVVTVLSDDKAPVPWWAPSAWVKWWSEDPNSAAIALATAAVAAFSLGLAIYQAFFSKAARESERRIRGYVEREGRQTRDHIDAHHDRSEAASQTRHEDVTDRLARIEAAISPGGLDRAEAAGLNKAQVETLLTAFAHEGVPADQAEALLLQSARELTELRARLARATNDEPEIAALLQAAAEAIDIPDLRRADELLSRAEEADLAEGARRIDRAARTIARRAELARSQARLLDAADLYGRAAGVISPHDTEAAWGYWLDEADALQAHGDLFPGLDVLRRAVTALRDRALPLAPEQDRPADWAATQNNLGNALSSLGDRAGGSDGLAALNEAVAAYRAALRVYTEAAMPAQWAAIQNNLGNALASLGERAGGLKGLEALNEAVAAYRAALRVRTEADMPAQWAMTTENLCLVYETQSEITRDPGPVCAAVADMDRVIAVYERMQAGFYIDKARRNRALMAGLCRELGGTCAD